MERSRILEMLERRLREARMWRERASAAFDSASSGFPGRTPTAESIERIRTASEEYSRSLLALERTLREHGEFVLNGKIPADLDAAVGDSLSGALEESPGGRRL